jgi:O-antigen ligase
MTIGILWAGNQAVLRFSTLHYVVLLVMAMMTATVTAEFGLRWLLRSLFAGAVVQALIAFLQVAHNGPLGWWSLGEIERFDYDPLSYYRAPGLSMHPNYLGGYLMIALFAAVLLAYDRYQRGFRPVIPTVAGGLVLGGIVATLSRSAMLSTAAGLLPLIIALVRTVGPRVRRVFLLLLIVMMVVAFLWGFVVLRGDFGNLAYRFFLPREFFFDYSWRVIEQQPILGTGAGNLMLRIGQNEGVSDLPLLPVHNVYLCIWAELGLVGLTLFVVACWRTLRGLLAAQAVGVIWGCCWIAMLVVMLFDNYLWAVHPFRVLMFWVIGVGWGWCVSAQAESKPES